MPSSAAMPMTIMQGNDLEHSFRDPVQAPRTDGRGGSGSGASESMIPKLFPVYAFI